jgi:hypothetical protein
MSYKVVVPCVIARDRERHAHHHYEGALIPWLADDQAQRFLDEGLVEKVTGAAPSDSSDDGPPAKTALKEEWVNYVVAKTATTNEPVSVEDADAMSKADLIELYG